MNDKRRASVEKHIARSAGYVRIELLNAVDYLTGYEAGEVTAQDLAGVILDAYNTAQTLLSWTDTLKRESGDKS